MDPLEVRDRLRSIERRRVELLDEAQRTRNQCTHERAILVSATAGFSECMACDKRWDELPESLRQFVVISWRDTMRNK